jgi:hypothetical protein
MCAWRVRFPFELVCRLGAAKGKRVLRTLFYTSPTGKTCSLVLEGYFLTCIKTRENPDRANLQAVQAALTLIAFKPNHISILRYEQRAESLESQAWHPMSWTIMFPRCRIPRQKRRRMWLPASPNVRGDSPERTSR